MFIMKSGEYLEKANIYGANFDSGICISMEYIHVKVYMTPILQISILCKNGNKWPTPCIVRYAIGFVK